MRPVTDWCKHFALFFDDNGYYLGKKRVKWSEKTFSFKARSYNFVPEKSTFFKLRTIFSTRKYYLYNLDNPMPFLLNKNPEP